MDDSLLGYRIKPYIKTYDFVNKTSLISNKEGFMSIGETEFEYGHKKPADVYRIVMIGGSTVYGAGVATPDLNLPARLLKTLRKNDSTKKYEVINAGAAGYRSSNELLYIISELVNYSPDLIIIYGGWNDLIYNNDLYSEHRDLLNTLKIERHYALDARLADIYSVKGNLKLLLSSTAELASYTATGRLIKGILEKTASSLSKTSIYDKRSVDLFRRNLMVEIMVSKVYGYKLALFLQPIMGVNERKYTENERTFYDKIQDLSMRKAFYADAVSMFNGLINENRGDKNVCIADLSHSLDNAPETVYFDTGHLVAKGNDVVADAIIEKIAKCGFLH
jgi:lysophospholipase L1-like esterase